MYPISTHALSGAAVAMGALRFLAWLMVSLGCCIAVWLGPKRWITPLSHLWARWLVAIARMRVNVRWHIPKENVSQLSGAVVISNHQSYADIPLIQWVMAKPLFYMAKREFFWVPFIGQAMRKAGFVSADRKRRGKSNVDEPVRKIFAQGRWLFVAPEGTRSPTGAMLPFRSGAFWIAHHFQVPIVVVGVRGSRNVLPKHSFWIRAHCVVDVSVLAILAPTIEPEALKAQARAHLEQFLAQQTL